MCIGGETLIEEHVNTTTGPTTVRRWRPLFRACAKHILGVLVTMDVYRIPTGTKLDTAHFPYTNRRTISIYIQDSTGIGIYVGWLGSWMVGSVRLLDG